MKFKILLLTVSLFTLSASVFANPVIDSIGVKNNDGKKMVVFKVKAKDTYYSIGRRYNIKPEILKKFNGAKKDVLSIGAVIYVPTDIPFKKSKKEAAAETTKETKAEKKERLAHEAKEAREQERQERAEAKEREEAATPSAQPQQQQQVVQVSQPVQTPQVTTQAPAQQDSTPPTQYKVSQGETLYSIAKRFSTTVDDITKINNLTSTTLSAGQILTVRPGYTAPKPQPAIIPAEQQAMKDGGNVSAVIKDSSNGKHLDANKFGLYEKNEKGVATWIDDPSLDPHKMLVLHRTAPIGTIIKITNPMTNRTTFAKVVGTFTDSESTRDCIVVMTKNVADSLGAIDKRFHVNISYGSPNE